MPEIPEAKSGCFVLCISDLPQWLLSRRVGYPEGRVNDQYHRVMKESPGGKQKRRHMIGTKPLFNNVHAFLTDHICLNFCHAHQYSSAPPYAILDSQDSKKYTIFFFIKIEWLLYLNSTGIYVRYFI
jgi:hypothetical protein